MSDASAGLRRSASVMTRWPALIRCYAVLHRLGVSMPPRASLVRRSRRSGRGLVVSEALVPDAADHLAWDIAHLALQGEAHVGSAGEAEFQQLGVVGGDLHGEVHVDSQLLDQVDQLVQGVGQGEGNQGEPRFQDEDGRTAGAQRGRGDDGGQGDDGRRAVGGAHRPAAGPVPPGRERAVGLTGIASTAASAVIGEPGLQLGIERTDQPVKAVAHPGDCVTEIAALLVMRQKSQAARSLEADPGPPGRVGPVL